jgi:hypothetical protein
MIVDLPPALRLYVWAAVGDYVRQLRRDGRSVPGELADLHARLAPDRPDLTHPAVRARVLHRARNRRYEARKRGQDVPLRRPGPVPKVATEQQRHAS